MKISETSKSAAGLADAAGVMNVDLPSEAPRRVGVELGFPVIKLRQTDSQGPTKFSPRLTHLFPNEDGT